MDARARPYVRLSAGVTSRDSLRHCATGLTLTHEVFFAKVKGSTAFLRISEAATAGLGAASSL
jgi:hypothetical protein